MHVWRAGFPALGVLISRVGDEAKAPMRSLIGILVQATFLSTTLRAGSIDSFAPANSPATLAGLAIYPTASERGELADGLVPRRDDHQIGIFRKRLCKNASRPNTRPASLKRMMIARTMSDWSMPGRHGRSPFAQR